MIFTKPMWLLGAALTLETMRRGYLGGSALSLFVIVEFGLSGAVLPTIAHLRTYLAIEEGLLDSIPPFLSFLVTPFQDYYDSMLMFCNLLDMLAVSINPTSCSIYWQKEEEWQRQQSKPNP